MTVRLGDMTVEKHVPPMSSSMSKWERRIEEVVGADQPQDDLPRSVPSHCPPGDPLGYQSRRAQPEPDDLRKAARHQRGSVAGVDHSTLVPAGDPLLSRSSPGHMPEDS